MDTSLSYLSTPIVEGYMYESIPERLRKLAEEDGDKEAFVYYNRTWKRTTISRKELYDRSMSLAKILVEDGLRHKATVGFCMANSINMLIANMAVVCAGGIPFYMGTNLKDGSDVIQVMNDLECEMFIVDTEVGDANWNILETIWPKQKAMSESVPSLKVIICNGHVTEGIANRQTLLSLLSRNPDINTSLPDVQPEDTIAYFCTSGTTGRPKEVIYTHFCISNWTKQTDYVSGITKNSRFFNDRTFSWVFGYPRTYLTEGTTRIFVDPVLTTSGKHVVKMCEVIAAENCDVVYIPNYLVVDLLENPDLCTQFANVQTIMSSGERFQKSTLGLADKFCKRLIAYYGCTEAGGSLIFESTNVDSYEDGIIGKPIGGTEVKLIDQSGTVVPRGTRGELCIRSSWRCVGYRGNETLFRSTLDDANWFHTGDIARVREDGNLVVEGRQRELISMQTTKFFPWSIEHTLMRMHNVSNAFAVGIPDKRSFEVVCACVVPKEGVTITCTDVKQYCDDVFLEESSALVVTTKPVYHVVLKEVPRTRSGKIDRLKIRSIAIERLGL